MSHTAAAEPVFEERLFICIPANHRIIFPELMDAVYFPLLQKLLTVLLMMWQAMNRCSSELSVCVDLIIFYPILSNPD